MAPAKARPTYDDSKTEYSTSREKVVASTGNATSKAKRNGASLNLDGTAAKEGVQAAVVNKPASYNNDGVSAPKTGGPTINWQSEDRELLQAYRISYKLDVPPSFKMPASHMVLENFALGRNSPTMVRRASRRRVNRDQLARAVRKNFNSLAVNETDVIANMLYKVHSQDGSFRMRFAPASSKNS